MTLSSPFANKKKIAFPLSLFTYLCSDNWREIWIFKSTYPKGGKTRDPLGITILIPCRFCVMSWSSWNHSTEGGGLPEARHSSRAPVELENVIWLGGWILHWGDDPRFEADEDPGLDWTPPRSIKSERSVRPPTPANIPSIALKV